MKRSGEIRPVANVRDERPRDPRVSISVFTSRISRLARTVFVHVLALVPVPVLVLRAESNRQPSERRVWR